MVEEYLIYDPYVTVTRYVHDADKFQYCVCLVYWYVATSDNILDRLTYYVDRSKLVGIYE
jgi:hypothetical protein